MAEVSAWEDTLSRRTAIATLLGVLITACGGGSRSGPSAAAPATTTPSATTAATGGSTPAAPTTAAPATLSGVAPTTAVVRGANAYVTTAVLTDNAHSYNGRWSGAWKEPGSGLSGTVTGTVAIDPTARTYTLAVTIGADFLPGEALPTATGQLSVDAYTYDGNTGSFAIHQTTPLGKATVTSVGGIGTGTFKLVLTEIPGHTDVASIECTGVAYKPDEIPVDVTVRFQDGTSKMGHLSLTPSH